VFDAVASLLVLNVMPEAGRAVREMARVARPGGTRWVARRCSATLRREGVTIFAESVALAGTARTFSSLSSSLLTCQASHEALLANRPTCLLVNGFA
jgi:ubiquinone/menaquinone biosynthesis C-methylase UbiE